MRKYNPEQDQFCGLFARLSRSNFRSRFHLKDKDIQYIREKGLDDHPQPCCRFCANAPGSRPRSQMMANRLQCEDILYSWLSMLLAVAVGDVCISGIEFQAGVQLTEVQTGIHSRCVDGVDLRKNITEMYRAMKLVLYMQSVNI